MKLIFKIALLCTITFLSINNSIAQAPAPETPRFPSEPKEQLKYFANQYGSDYTTLNRVVTCESGWRSTAIGDHGLAYGFFQFHKPTFEVFAKEMGITADYYSAQDNLKVGAWAFAHGKQSHWTCK